MQPIELAPLSIVIPPDDRASAAGFLLEAALGNGMTLAGLWATLGLGHRGRPRPEHVPLLAWYTHAPASWLGWRVPLARRLDDRRVYELFGQMWHGEGALRKRRAQHCPICLRMHGPIALEWDLACVCACPEHGVVLQDHCAACGHSIELFRPSWDVCICGHYLTSAAETPVVADLAALRWCEWVAHAVHPELHDLPILPREVLRGLHGLSVDGASRIVIAFGGGQRRLDSLRLSAAQRWLTTAAVHDVVSAGMARFQEFILTRRLAGGMPALAVADLMNLAVVGLTAGDRTRAAWLIGLLNGHRVPRRVQAAATRQMDLFADDEGQP